MRTTLNIDDDVFERAKSLAQARRMSVGEALSMLARRGMEVGTDLRVDPVTGLLVIHIEGPPITNEDIERILEEEDLDNVRRFYGENP